MQKKLDYVDLSEFLKGKDPICREERQYALFLYNILRDMKEINIEGETYYIQEAFFEGKR